MPHLPALDFYTFYGDINVVPTSLCPLTTCVPVGQKLPVGDIIMQTGESTPYGTQLQGGARFRYSGTTGWEWGMTHDIPIYQTTIPIIDLGFDISGSKATFAAPENHINFGDPQNGLTNVLIPDCMTGILERADVQMVNVLRARLSGQGDYCRQP